MRPQRLSFHDIHPVSGHVRVRYQPWIPRGRDLELHPNPGKVKSACKVNRLHKRLIERQAFGDCTEAEWLQKVAIPQLHPSHQFTNSRLLQMNGKWVREDAYLEDLKNSLRPAKFASNVIRCRNAWSLPCAQNYKKARIGDSQINRLPNDPEWLSIGKGYTIPLIFKTLHRILISFIGYPGADLADLICIAAGRQVSSLQNPRRHEIALDANIDQEPCRKCLKHCWSNLQELVLWCGHNNSLRSVPNSSIHPPLIIPTYEVRSYGEFFITSLHVNHMIHIHLPMYLIYHSIILALKHEFIRVFVSEKDNPETSACRISGPIKCREYENRIVCNLTADEIASRAPIRRLLRKLDTIWRQKTFNAEIKFLQLLRPLSPSPKKGWIQRPCYSSSIHRRLVQEINCLSPAKEIKVFDYLNFLRL